MTLSADLKDRTSRGLFLCLGYMILLLSFASSSGRHLLPKFEEMKANQKNERLSRILESEIEESKQRQQYFEEKNQLMNSILNNRYRQKLTERLLTTEDQQKSKVIPIYVIVMVIALKFCMQLMSAWLFRLAPSYKKRLVNNPKENASSIDEDSMGQEINEEKGGFGGFAAASTLYGERDTFFNPRADTPTEVNPSQEEEKPGENFMNDVSSQQNNESKQQFDVFSRFAESVNLKSDITNLEDAHSDVQPEPIINRNESINIYDPKLMKDKLGLSNRDIAKALNLKDSEVSVALNKSPAIIEFLHNKLNGNYVEAQ
jgi:hypothetical protein